jgi:hypothetical protein
MKILTIEPLRRNNNCALPKEDCHPAIIIAVPATAASRHFLKLCCRVEGGALWRMCKIKSSSEFIHYPVKMR